MHIVQVMSFLLIMIMSSSKYLALIVNMVNVYICWKLRSVLWWCCECDIYFHDCIILFWEVDEWILDLLNIHLHSYKTMDNWFLQLPLIPWVRLELLASDLRGSHWSKVVKNWQSWNMKYIAPSWRVHQDDSDDIHFSSIGACMGKASHYEFFRK